MNTIGARAVEDDSFGGESRKINSMVYIMLCLYLFCPFSVTAADIPGWQEVIFKDEPATRFVSGIWHQNRVVAGTHNPGSVYTFELDPFGSGVKRVFFPDKEAPTEAVLDLVAFQDRLYGVVEKSPSEIRRTHRESGVWEPVEIPVMEGFYFGAVFKGQLLVTGGLPKRGGITVFRSADGRRFEQAAVLPDWAWVPAVFQEQFYLVGHKGSAYFNGGTAGFRSSDGIRYDPVPALEGEFQYQCAYPWKGHLYLGTGGWTTDRKAKNQARIYRYDGTKRELVLGDIQMNGITSLAACGRYLFALADSGWETPEGASALYRTANGKDWEQVRTFPHPEMRRIIPINNETLLLLGGKNRAYGVALRNDTVCQKE